jgi:tRNA (guanine-N7-)-methyltransferase
MTSSCIPLKFNLQFIDNIYLPSTEVKPQIIPFSSYEFINVYDIFGNSLPLNLEIGSGNGEFIENIALLHNNENFLGFEIVKKVLIKAVKRIKRSKLSNVRLIHYDVLFFLKMLKNNSLKNIYINFPDPWPKRKHNKRRLVKIDFLSMLHNKLEKNGSLYIVTDFADYACEITANISKSPFRNYYNTPYVNYLDNYFETKYYKKFAKDNQVFFFKLIK